MDYVVDDLVDEVSDGDKSILNFSFTCRFIKIEIHLRNFMNASRFYKTLCKKNL